MDFNYIPTQKQMYQNLSKPNNKRLTLDQVRFLETSFQSNPKLLPDRKLELAAKLGMSPRQIAIWYQNRRARHKTEKIELDYRTIQLKLDNVLVEKRRLEKEVGVLKQELNRAQQMILLASTQSSVSLPSGSASGNDEHISSSSINNDNFGSESAYGSENGSGLQVEDLYTCLAYWP
ncbi:hypothetical protein FNV43_RR13752 [Rhamnella rubrinervis]|uniref:Homeobox-leucine zipper protein n=1 Tax=Rhamnella rubrinervis TaxID=2594499 RepID=A0A8K0H1K3_9ROSA|nr:hypothetical protein FNV43_RR13752 [Rhamnella rubrinervis]